MVYQHVRWKQPCSLSSCASWKFAGQVFLAPDGVFAVETSVTAVCDVIKCDTRDESGESYSCYGSLSEASGTPFLGPACCLICRPYFVHFSSAQLRVACQGMLLVPICENAINT